MDDQEILFGIEMTHLQVIVVKLLITIVIAGVVNDAINKFTTGFAPGTKSFIQGVINLAMMAALIWYFRDIITS